MPSISAQGTACFLEFFFLCVCVMCEYFSYGLS